MSAVEVRVPDIGDAKGVAVLDVLVKKALAGKSPPMMTPLAASIRAWR